MAGPVEELVRCGGAVLFGKRGGSGLRTQEAHAFAAASKLVLLSFLSEGQDSRAGAHRFRVSGSGS